MRQSFSVHLSLLPGFCGYSVVSADGGLTEASVQERPLVVQPQRESRPGQCALLLELVMDKVSAVLRPLAPVGARDHDTVSRSCGSLRL